MEEDYVPQEIEISNQEYSTTKKGGLEDTGIKRRKERSNEEAYSPEPDQVDQQLEVQDTHIQQFEVDLLETGEESHQRVLYYEESSGKNQVDLQGNSKYESVKEAEVQQEIEGAEYATEDRRVGYSTQQSIEEEAHLEEIQYKLPLKLASN